MTIKTAATARNRGQTLGEFAIIFPILLMLLFGVIEFGRLFQSWVTLQNAARVAARYAVTGQYDEQKYDLDTLVPCETAQVAGNDGATDDDSNYLIVTYNAPYYDANNPSASYPLNVYRQNGVSAQYDESLYMTWYGVEDCAPNDESDQRRKDLLRMASIYDKAREGAAGLFIEPSRTGSGSQAEFTQYIEDMWSNPSPRVDDPAYFEVTMCSTRQRLYGNELTNIVDNPDDTASLDPATRSQANFRFYLYQPGSGPSPTLNLRNQANSNTVTTVSPDFPTGVCIMKEQALDPPLNPFTPADKVLDIYDRPTNDAGDAGDRVIITVTYNHPLITPLGLARYIRLQARRAAVNESFKVTNAERALGGAGQLAPEPPTPIPPTPVTPPTDTPIPPPTSTNTPTPPPTDTPTPGPFDCDLVTAEFQFFDVHSALVEIKNGNQYYETYLERVVLHWQPATLAASQPDAYVAFESLEGDVYWIGYESETSVSSSAPTPLDSTDVNKGDDLSAGGSSIREEKIISEVSSILWKGTWGDIQGARLSDYMHPSELANTSFYMHNPSNPGTPCNITITVPDPPPAPTDLPPGFQPSATFTPDCADARVSIEFVRFDSLGDVRLRVTNNRTIESEFTGFTLAWPDHRPIKFVKMVVGGSNANDVNDPFNNPGGTGIIVWQNTSGGAETSTTNSSNGSQGQWMTNFIFPPNSVTDIHLDFTGVGSATLQSIGSHASEFNGSSFRISCGRAGSGPGNGSGNNPSGDITFSEVPPPGPTSPPQPTNTLGPTLTPSATRTAGPPTNTFTPRPPTQTFTPSPTLQASATNTPSKTPTDIDFGCPDGNC